ncbi:hypothetical protein C8R47DRAFT_1217925 [Mycena vitilis]|nr:hypothetical protein C8R47DRAFT_1217925 [Mycena vitilis]
MRLPTLRCIGFLHCSGVPASLVAHGLTRYQQVSFADSDFDHTNILFTNHHSARHILASMPDAKHTIITDPTMIAYMEGSLQHIRHLTLGARPPGSLHGASQIATMCADSLQHLVIKFDEYHDEPVELPRIPKAPFPDATGQGQEMPGPALLDGGHGHLPDRVPNAEVVTVMIDAQHKDELMHIRHHPITDNALKQLPRLREVDFDLFGFLRPSGFVRQILPLAGEAGLLSFSFSTSSRDIYDRVNNPMRYFSN